MENYYLKYNETILSDDYIITRIDKQVLPAKKINTINISSLDGEIYNGCKYNSYTATIELVINQPTEFDYKIAKKDLRDVLVVKEQVPIAFNTERVGFGICDGEVNIKDKSENSGVATFTLLFFEPYFYSIEESLFEGTGTSKPITLANYGGLPVKPFLSIGFTKDAHFLQLQNTETKQQMLIGRYPSIDLSTSSKPTYVMKDDCSDLSLWTPTSSNLADGRGTGGTFSTSSKANGTFILGTFANDTSNTWKGAAYRRSLQDVNGSTSVQDFEAVMGFTFTSTGKNGDPANLNYKDDPSSDTSLKTHTGYEVTASSLNVRKGPSTKYTKVGTLKKGFQIQVDWSIVNGWVKFKHTKQFGDKWVYCSMKYLKKITWTQKVTVKESNWVTVMSTPLRDKPTLKGKKLASIPMGTCIRCITSTTYNSTDGGKPYKWYKLANKYNGKMGYVCLGNIAQASDVTFSTETELLSADDLTGIIEFYGMSTTGAQLFRLQVSDDTQWYESNRPRVVIDGKTISDFPDTPPPKKMVVNLSSADTTSQEKYEVTYYHGGTFGDWNDLYGQWYIRRNTHANGKCTYTIQLRRIKNGNILQSKAFKYTSYAATDPLAYIAIYIGAKGTDKSKMSSISADFVNVKRLDEVKDPTVSNIKYFQEGDILDIDFTNRKVYLNQTMRNDLLDIGSEFFDIQPGETPVKFISDDNNIVIGATIREKWVGDE